MFKKIVLLLSLLLTTPIFAQEIEFGKVSKEELMETQYMNDKSADAAILYSSRNTYFTVNVGGAQMITEIHKRIKIYTQNGYDKATEEVNLFKNRSSNESMGRIKAYTFNLEDGKIVKSELEKDQVFKTEIRYNFNQVKFTMPNVKEGSILDIKYKVTSPFIWNVDEFRFQADIPIKRLYARLKRPKGFVFKPTFKGYISIYPKTSAANSSGNSDLIMVKDEYNLTNIPALKDEVYVDNVDNYRAGAMYELVSIDLPTLNRSYARSWKEVAETIGSSIDYKKELNKSGSYDDIVDELISGVSDDNEKVKILFKYIKDNITWNGIDGKYFYHGTKKALKEKKGSAGDINLSLVSMLRYAGLKANPVVISTKENAVPYFPTVDRLNYVLVHVIINEEAYFMDATDEFSDLNLLPIKDYNWQGVLINNNDEVWKKINIKKPKKSMGQYQLKAKLSSDGSLEGNYKAKLTNHHGYEFRKNFKNQDLETFISERESRFDDIEISDYKTENTETYDGHLLETFDFYQENGADVIGEEIYFHPMIFFKMKSNPFKQESRLFPIDFGYAFKDMYIISVDIPEGYSVKSKPDPVVVRLPNSEGAFRFSPAVNGQKILLNVSYEINQAMIAAETYQIIKEYYNQMILKGSEPIILKKTQ